MKVYLVGGAVRDKLLGYPTNEYDYVVVGATPEQMQAQGFTPVGKDFPVFLHPETKDEYALARTERKTGHGYQGFTFDTSTEVTLEEDLGRRDITINAIAQLDNGELVDPYNGQNDIDRRVLRHVSEAFREDPVRVLRIARFASRYHHLGFTIAKETKALMGTMVASGEVAHLVSERVWKEFSRALGERSPHVFLEVLHECGALKVIMPQIDHLISLHTSEQPPQLSPPALRALNYACSISDKSTVRLATLLHDLDKQNATANPMGKPSPELVELTELAGKLMIPNEYRELCSLVIRFHKYVDRALSLLAEDILDLLTKTDSLRRPERFKDLLTTCKSYAVGTEKLKERKYKQERYLLEALEVISTVNPQALLAQGFSGKALGDAIAKQRIEKLEEFKSQQ
ncbi:multifunctional CCA addition/repair protein [Agarilytica rhodophyticola]|uniref:multifunctional CCA addition/repair protein n=1 Tax=Agarilytica rhodophyticola TaxID=1737490 RepID=UPI000B346497|nr:multifunctional CCA addition/repair protein [Agarilytica rhodophyticola]